MTGPTSSSMIRAPTRIALPTMPDQPIASPPWFSVYALAPYEGSEPAFYDCADFPWAMQIEHVWPVFLQELENWLQAGGRATPYFRQSMASGGQWKTLPLMTWGLEYHRTMRHFPRSMAALAQIDGLVSVAFNVLEAGARINPHYGDTNCAIRFHLPLKVPGTLPSVGLQVGDEQRSWQTGGLLGFTDGYIHSAWNDSGEDRYILLLDVIRPAYCQRKSIICATVLGSLAVQALFQHRLAWLQSHRRLLRLIHFMARLSAWTLSPVFNIGSRASVIFSRKN